MDPDSQESQNPPEQPQPSKGSQRVLQPISDHIEIEPERRPNVPPPTTAPAPSSEAAPAADGPIVPTSNVYPTPKSYEEIKETERASIQPRMQRMNRSINIIGTVYGIAFGFGMLSLAITLSIYMPQVFQLQNIYTLLPFLLSYLPAIIGFVLAILLLLRKKLVVLALS